MLLKNSHNILLLNLNIQNKNFYIEILFLSIWNG